MGPKEKCMRILSPFLAEQAGRVSHFCEEFANPPEPSWLSSSVYDTPTSLIERCHAAEPDLELLTEVFLKVKHGTLRPAEREELEPPPSPRNRRANEPDTPDFSLTTMIENDDLPPPPC